MTSPPAPLKAAKAGEPWRRQGVGRAFLPFRPGGQIIRPYGEHYNEDFLQLKLGYRSQFDQEVNFCLDHSFYGRS
jgi:hypothetical protein